MSVKFTFLGTGTSQGVPVISCDCKVCRSEDFRDSRLRTSGLLQSDQTSVVFDTGPDFRQQMLRAAVHHLDAVVFTHQHKDHTAGLDDVRAYNYLQNRDMPVYATQDVIDHLHREYYYIFETKDYPGVPKLKLHTIDPEQDLHIGDLVLTPIPMMHGRMPVLGYRCGDFAYLTDTNHIPASSLEKLRGVRHLVIDALRHEKHYSHFTLQEAIGMVDRIQPERAFLIHLSHLMGTHAETEAGLPDHIRISYDGLEISFH